ncbi:aspartyl-phosphate phosphatase Spo0E family protein [Crassaminicella thermophila]|uniref:Aspartyl-phosphate phosphatase Spo0E family protein n=1 Tax=Crassaminicella thermophila TaxID=2599308 RepID=A0A5C0SFW0_CRATE|nr:aspartyl-phosphate phosphatase Spo0E family protein [Crassaminicella thermophila]QEK12168.1 aspartyl-phosphate phosphatase Spo0E family protein [Crassaminicella thermophila]
MNEPQNIQIKIKILRDKMHELIDEKENLLAAEVIHISQMLDKVLNYYYQVKNQN